MNVKKAFHLSTLTFLASLLLFSGCNKQDTKSNSSQPVVQATGNPADGDEILVGAVFPMTGPIATYGQESVNGIKLALQKFGGEKIKGKKIRLIIEDNKGEPTESANAVRKLINVDKVHVVVGSVASSNTLAGAPIAQQAGVPLMTPASTNEKVTQTGEFISRTCFTDDFQGVVMAKFAKETLKKSKAAIIVDNASDYSKGLSKVFRAEFAKLGGEVIPTEYTYTAKDQDFRSLLSKVKRSKPDVVFLPGYYTEVGLILKQAKQMGLNVPFLGGDGWDSPKLQEIAGAEGVKGNYISSHFSPDDQDPTVQSFVKEYTENFGSQKPGAMAALGYDGMLVVLDALKRAPKLDYASINSAIINTKGFKGITGSITIDENRNARKSAVVLKTLPEGMAFEQKVNP
ncbi:MAG: ABC transporter substrate-binding protein [Oligoflexia bacterium]|nr:ABC transporter substrate-binding protein [Oligoflexia bacterium]